MVLATPTTVTHPRCDARDAYETLMANIRDATPAAAMRKLAEAESRGTSTFGRAHITHDGYVRDAQHYDAGTALYRVTLGRLI